MRELFNFGIILKVISRNLFITAIALILCSAVSFYYDESAVPFLIPSLTALITGLVCYLTPYKQKNETTVHKKDAYLTVTLSWLLISIIGCLPYIISKSIPFWVDAFFESISGFTTTGASILRDIEMLPKSILFWRSMTHWIGGIGIIVLVILIMPSLHIGGYHLFTLESSLQEKIQPKIHAVGYRLLFIYISLTIFEVVLLKIGGMSLFESVCHAFGTVATGGFSPKNSSIAGYSPYIQYVIMVFMFLSGINYVIHYALVKKDFKKITKNEELKLYILAVFATSLFCSASLFLTMHKPVESSIREGFFQVISIITCTGFATADYMQWPVYAWFVIFIAMFFGGSTGSTAGGIKMARHVIVLKNIRRLFRQLIYPKAVLQIRLNGNMIDEETNSSILAFVGLYILIFAVTSLMLMVTGLNTMEAGSSVATCMAGIGPGLGSVGPAGNYAHLNSVAKLTLSGSMLLGRLEIYTVILLFTREFWKN